MSVPLEKIERDLLRLPANVRAHLAEVLRSSLEDQNALADEWLDEADRRYRKYLAGELRPIPAREALAEVRARLKK